MNAIEIRKVKIGDKFIDPRDRKSKRVSIVYDFVERKSVTTGEIGGYECWAKHDFLGQEIRFEVSFTTVLRNKVN